MLLSNFTITLGKSNDFLRAAFLIHIFAAIVLLKSSFPIILIIAMITALAFVMVQIIKKPLPVTNYTHLDYRVNHWLLHQTKGQIIQYDRAYICFDGGLFKLLALSNKNTEKKLLIFNDQLTPFQLRALHIIGKISSKKKSSDD